MAEGPAMSQPPKSVRMVTSIRLASGKNTLVLEGEPDRTIYQIWLGKLAGGTEPPSARSIWSRSVARTMS